MTTTSIGKQAEDLASEYLKSKGFVILEQNWRTRYCEIDIVTKKDDKIFFIEVKYRKTNNWGGGADYITKKKFKQMSFASEIWISENQWTKDYQLAVIEISGTNFEITNFITDF